jgi:hypothetical protein
MKAILLIALLIAPMAHANGLSERDIQILKYTIEDLSDEEIQRQLFINDQAEQLDEAIDRMQPESEQDERMISYEPLS